MRPRKRENRHITEPISQTASGLQIARRTRGESPLARVLRVSQHTIVSMKPWLPAENLPKYPAPKCSQFCRQPISKSVIIGDVPIAIREWEGKRKQQPCRSGRCQKSFIFQRLIDRFNCLCYERVNKVRASKRAILSSSMAEHSAVNRRVVGSSPT